MTDRGEPRPRAVVCGTKFGRIYLAAFRRADCPFELAGILANGSARSHRCAEYYDVPLFTRPDQLPGDVDVACVVVGGGVNGGRGVELALALMRRGIHVLQEHPVHEDELAACLREARQSRVAYHLNTHYVHVEPVRQFICAGRELIRRQRPLFVDAACAFQTAYTLLDILGETLGALRPWALDGPVAIPGPSARPRGLERPYRTVEAVIAEVPITLRVQHELDPSDPDNHIHVMHRITIGTEGGHLTLANTHGPTLWSPRAHLPAEAREIVRLEDSGGDEFDLPSASSLGRPDAPAYREILQRIWPEAVVRALLDLRRAMVAGETSLRRGQYYLSLSRLWLEITALLGPLRLAPHAAPQILALDDLQPAMVQTRSPGETHQRRQACLRAR